MATRLKDWQKPFIPWDGIQIDENNVISVLLRATNNLIHVNGDGELYTDLQLEDGILPTDDFPVGVTTGKILQEDWWPQNGIILNWKTTSGDYNRLIYANDWKLYLDPGTWIWNEIGGSGWGWTECNTKTFFISWPTDITTAQAILDWQRSWKNALIWYGGEIYLFEWYNVGTGTPAEWQAFNSTIRHWVGQWYSETVANIIKINYDTTTGVVSSVAFDEAKITNASIDPTTQYNQAFMPTLPYQPASKAYVDQTVSWVYIYKWSVNTYSDLANIQNPEVWDVYNVIDSWMNYSWTGTDWDALWWTINYTAWDGIGINNWVISNTKPGATVSATAPSNPSEWDLWYDTTNDVLKSYNWTSWVECWEAWNVKAFFITSIGSSATALAEAQSIYDWYIAGKEPIVIYRNTAYILRRYQSGTVSFISSEIQTDQQSSISRLYYEIININHDGTGTVTSSVRSTLSKQFILETNVNYSTPYTPTYAWSPTTKKYVDDWDTYIWSSAPSTPYEWQLWYDTTNGVLKSYDWTNWNTIWSWGWGWTGDVVWPSSAVDWHLAVFDGITGKLIKDWGPIPGTATSSAAWLVKLGSDTQQTVGANSPSSANGRTYPVQTNSSWQMVVNVPWTDSWGWGWGGSYTPWDWIDITNSVISNTMYPSNQAAGNVGDILAKTANGTAWLDSWTLTNVKAWNVTSATSSTLESIVNWVNTGATYSAILKLDAQPDVFVYGKSVTVGSTTTYYFPSVENSKNADTTTWPSTWYTTVYNAAYTITYDGNTYTWAYVPQWQAVANVIEPTGVPYQGYFTPTADYHPATKKYVDDVVAWGWNVVVSTQANNVFTSGLSIWGWLSTDYVSLTKQNNTIYITYDS